MNSQKIIRRGAVFVAAAVAPVFFAVATPTAASAAPGLCVTGPYGYASACVDVPGVQIVYDGPGRGPHGPGKGHWKHGHWHPHP